MSFVKNGDAEKIVLIDEDENLDDAQTKLVLERAQKSVEAGELGKKDLEKN